MTETIRASTPVGSAVHPPALVVSQASKTFGMTRVLHGVDLRIEAGEIRALVGENGSGKSTLVKILSGFYVPDEGTGAVSVGGQDIAPHRSGESDAAGLRFVHQDLGLVGQLNTFENLGLGRGYGSKLALPVRWKAQRRRAQQEMLRLGYHFDVERPVAELEASERTAVAVARAVSDWQANGVEAAGLDGDAVADRSQHGASGVVPGTRGGPQVLVLDEPTVNLPGREVRRLLELVRRLRDSGIAILFITHHLNEVFELADTVTVLRNGSLITTQPVRDFTEDSLIELMVGRSVSRASSASPGNSSTPVVRIEGLSGATVRGIDLNIGAGEIVGVAGVTGSGREAVAPLLFGAVPRQGSVTVDGQQLKGGRPDLSIAAGMGLIPADRAQNAVIRGLDVGENLTVARLSDFMTTAKLAKRSEQKEIASWMDKLDVRPRRPRLACSQLSGGNAQKVILARWLRLRPKVLVLDEPTQGVDVGAKEDIHRNIDTAAQEGCALLVCSTDHEELVRLCSRVLVLVHGKVAYELHAPFDIDQITAASLASTKE